MRRLVGVRPLVLTLMLLLIVAPVSPGQEPSVLRVQVPSSKVGTYFPPGTPISSLPAAEFDALIEGARRARREAVPPPRILQASHEARWVEGVLDGTSSFVIERGGRRPAFAPLAPWTPAVEVGSASTGPFRTDADGTSGLWIAAQTPDVVTARWKVRSLPGSDGRNFDIALPDLPRSTLVLELPVNLVPGSLAGTQSGPTPGTRPGTHRWRFDAPRLRNGLRLRDATSAVELNGIQGVWYHELVSASVEDSRINWTIDWTVELGQSVDRRILVDLAPGLDLLDVASPIVLSHEVVDQSPERTRLRLRLGESNGTGPFPIRLRGISAVPASGNVLTPSAQLVGANWTGCRTVVRSTSRRELAGIVNKNGRQVPSKDASPSLLTFESDRPGPVAELSFAEPSARSLVSIRGVIRLNDNVPRLEARIDWNVVRGRLLSGAIQLPRNWSVERFGSLGERESVAWHTEPGADGTQRLVWSTALTPDANRAPFELVASASGAGVVGPLDIPRVIPLDASVNDDLWAIVPGPALSLLPRELRRMDWVEPEKVVGATSLSLPADQLPGTLSWRWLDAGGSARFDRIQEASPTRARMDVAISLEPARVLQTWKINLERLAPDVRTIPIFCADGGPARIRWRLADGGTAQLQSRPLDAQARDRWGIPAAATGWLLTLPIGTGVTAGLIGDVEESWDGTGRFAIPRLPDEFAGLGVVSVRHDPMMRPKLAATGLDRIDLLESRARDLNLSGPKDGATFRYFVSGPEPVLEIQSEPADPTVDLPLIREAVLQTEVAADGGSTWTLFLRAIPIEGRPLEFRIPQGVTLLKALQNGKETPVARRGELRQIDLQVPVGSTSSTIELRYVSDDIGGRSPSPTREISPIVPAFEAACLAFSWEVYAPSGYEIRGRTIPWATWESLDLIGTFRNAIPGRLVAGFPGRDPAPEDLKDRMGSIEARLTARGGETLGELLLRLDGGNWPVVIDRFALMARGIGDATPLSPPTGTGSAFQALAQQLSRIGLSIEASASALLITGEAADRDASDPPEVRARAIAEAARSGADRSRTFVSLAGWLSDGSWRQPIPRPGRDMRRLTRLSIAGWPGPNGTTVRLRDASADRYRIGFLAASFLLAGLLIASYSRRSVWLMLAVLWSALSLAPLLGFEPPRVIGSSVSLGTLALMLCWLGGSLRGRSRRTSPVRAPGPGSTLRRSGTLLVAVAFVSLAWAVRTPAQGTLAASEPPIVALYPYDGAPDPSRRPDRVILRLSDLKRLREMARRTEEASAGSRPLAASAVHVIQSSRSSTLPVESRYEIIHDGMARGSWTGPVGNARDLAASVDGQQVDIALTADGARFSVPIPGPGRHEVVIRRQVPFILGDGTRSIRLPINVAANSQIQILPDAAPEAEPIESLRAIGPWRVAQGKVEGSLGPVDHLDIKWSSGRRPETTRRPDVDSLILWDSLPAGDLARIRWTYRDTPTPLTTIGFELPPGLVLRSTDIPGVVDMTSQARASGTIWTARVDPPITRGAIVRLDVWRPAAPTGLKRSLPAVYPTVAGAVSGLVGFRRPSDRSGRLAGTAMPMEEDIEESFVKSWGELPTDGLTLSGVALLRSGPAPSVETGPILALRRGITRAVVAPDNGRLVIRMDSVLRLERGTTQTLRFRIAPEFDVWRIQSDRVSRWAEIGPGLYELQVTPTGESETIQIYGGLGVDPDALDHQVRRYSASLPWPTWEGISEDAGEFTVAGNRPFQIESGVGDGRGPYPARSAGGTRKLTWASDPPSVDVEISNRLYLTVDRASWTANLRFRVLGGPLDLIYLELPSDWAKDASVEMPGLDRQLTAETRGESTYWAVRPSHPVWGQALMVLRGSVPVQAGTTFAAPKLIPRGKGGVKSSLGLWNYSGRRLIAEGTQGLDEIEAAGLIPMAEAPPMISEPNMSFRISSEQWALKFQVGPARFGPDGPVTAQATRGTFQAVARADGGVIAESTFDLVPRSGEEFQLQFPQEARVAWAELGGEPLAATFAPSGLWRGRLPDQINGPLRIVWSTKGGGMPGPIHFPRLPQAELPRLGVVSSPDTLSWDVAGGAMERISAAAFPYQTIESRAARLAELVGAVSDFSDAGKLPILVELIQIELAYRQLLRAQDPGPDGTSTREDLVERSKLRLEQIRQNLDAAGLSDVWENAMWRSGHSETAPQRLRESITGRLSAPTQPPPLGIRSEFLADGPAALVLSPVIATSNAGPSLGRILLDLAVLSLAAGLGWILLRSTETATRWVWIPRAVLGLILAGLTVVSPQWIPLALALILLGRWIG